jgi:hypothetical protein
MNRSKRWRFGWGDREDLGRGADVLKFSTSGACFIVVGTSAGLFGVIFRDDFGVFGRAAVVFVGEKVSSSSSARNACAGLVDPACKSELVLDVLPDAYE